MSVNGNLLGYENGWQNQLKYSVPAEYTLAVPANPIRIYRKIVKRDVDTSMPITNINPLIRWRIPGNGQTLLDFRKCKIIISFNVFVNPPWLARPAPLAWNLIDRFRRTNTNLPTSNHRCCFIWRWLFYYYLLLL